MSLIKAPYVSFFLHTNFLGKIHLTNSEALVASARNVPAFWTERMRNATDDFTGVWIGVGRCLCVVLSPPRPLSTAASVRLWSCVAAPILVIAAVLDSIFIQPIARLLGTSLWLTGRVAIGALRSITPRSARWWDDAEPSDSSSEN